MDKPNIILIVADTMRRDAIGVYNSNVNTPNIDRLAADSMVYNNAISPSPWTVPSHASMFTGKYAIEHKIHETFSVKGFSLMGKMNGMKYITLAEILAANGYNTIAYSSNVNMVPGSGFDRGFNQFSYIKNYYKLIIEDELELKYGKRKAIKKYVEKYGYLNLINLYRLYKLSYNHYNGYPTDKGGYEIINNIKNMSTNTPFFMFLNFMEMHDPYFEKYTNEPDGLDNLMQNRKNNIKSIHKIKELYYKQAHYLDNYIGELIKFLKDNNIYDNTAIIFASDHGQEISEDYYGHGIFLSDNLIRVPLIVKYNGHGICKKYVSTIKIMDIIKNIAFNEKNNIFDESIFSEVYGINVDSALNYKERKELRRTCIYKNNYKLTVNSDKQIEEFTMDGKLLNIDGSKIVVNELLNDISIFNGSSDFINDFQV